MKQGRVTDAERPVVQIIWVHPRTDSLTATIVRDAILELSRCDVDVDEVDLYRDGFDAALTEPDEPDWNDLDKRYTPEVIAYTERTRKARAVVFVFPVWWYSMPAVMKGYIDRVWNHGTFYGGGRRISVPVVRWIGLAGETEPFFRKRRYDQMMAHHLDVGIAGYCGVEDSRLHLLYNTLGADVDDMPTHVAELRATARRVIRAVLERPAAAASCGSDEPAQSVLE